ncbi:predicted protein [Nematostella vectensis]|uniref:HORMA domain-containing protein n=1 Tax=Nematostella vectensis TaxID=45351 RepID=A7RLI6_NEMVE|nr:predicted protein [Nematostella vectensis]|eukprot:XP_001639673.1 predicted protein [Nematostella vectensis]
MATAQMVRNESKTVSWSSIFPPEQVTEQQSVLFVKKLLAVAVSSVSYLRAIFPEHAFGDRRLEDLNLKILKDDSACPGACQVIQWIKGCFDALDKKYLRMIVIGIYADADDPDTIIESYTFKNNHHLDTDPDITSRVKLRIKTELHQFELKEDDEEDDTTGVNAGGLIRNNADVDEGMEEDSQMPLDHTDNTPVTHSREFEAVDDHTPPTTPTETTRKSAKRQSDSQQVVPDGMECDKVPIESPNTPGLRGSAGGVSTRASSQPSGETPNIEEDMQKTDDTVSCACGYNEDDGLMIMCGICKFWEHAVCYGILQEEQAPDFHVCAKCCRKPGQPQCTDALLGELGSVELQAAALWRRALLACSEMSRILPTTMSRRLGVEMTVAHGLVNKLEKEGFVRSAAKGKRLGKIVNKTMLKEEELKEYIKKPKVSDKHLSNTQSQNTGTRQTAQSIDSITEKASMMDVSGRRRTKRNTDADEKDTDSPTKQKKKGGKRAISALDKTKEFDISDSQEAFQDCDAPARKRKSSISTKAILV